MLAKNAFHEDSKVSPHVLLDRRVTPGCGTVASMHLSGYKIVT
jgi:hypothetical protein